MNFPIIISIKSISLSKQEKNFISKIKPFGVIIFARNISNIPQISKLNETIKLLSKNTLIFGPKVLFLIIEIVFLIGKSRTGTVLILKFSFFR